MFISVKHICYLVRRETEKDDFIGIGIELRNDHMAISRENLDV